MKMIDKDDHIVLSHRYLYNELATVLGELQKAKLWRKQLYRRANKVQVVEVLHGVFPAKKTTHPGNRSHWLVLFDE